MGVAKEKKTININKERYSELMKQGKNDPKYQQRTMECQSDFDGIDSDITYE